MGKRYEELLVWQKAMLLAKEAYLLSRQLPQDERFGLSLQIRRSAVSVPSNIAEGQGRLTAGEFRQFLGQARGSLYELETQVKLAAQLGHVPESAENEFLKVSVEVAKLLNGLLTSLTTNN